MGCAVYTMFNKIIITPLCEILGIDKYGKVQREDRNWNGVKAFFTQKLEELKTLSTNIPVSQMDKLVQKCALKIIENVERQLSRMPFFISSVEPEIEAKMKHVPLSNSGCESNFAKLDSRTKDASGTVPIENISEKFIISTNNYLQSPMFMDNQEEEYKWARTSVEAKRAMELQDEFLSRVAISKKFALLAKIEAKERKLRKSVELLDMCKQHGGPLSPNTLKDMDQMTDEAIYLEAKYLKCTIASELKLRHRVMDAANPGKYKLPLVPVEQLKLNIQNILMPGLNTPTTELDTLLSQISL